MSAGDHAPEQASSSAASSSAQQPQGAPAAEPGSSSGPPTQGRKKQQPEPRRRIMSDAFMISRYKISMCKRTDPHNWRLCPYAHEGEAGRRRPPHMYQAVMCDFAKTKECPHGDGCPFARNPLEYWLHPDKYRTALCGQGEACTRNICFFAHNQQELRAPGSKPTGKPDKRPDAATDAAALLGQLSLGFSGGSGSHLLQQAQQPLAQLSVVGAWQSGPSSSGSGRAGWMRSGSGDVYMQQQHQQQQQLLLAQAQGLTSPEGGQVLAAAAAAVAAAAAAAGAGPAGQPTTPRGMPAGTADGLTYLDGAVSACPDTVSGVYTVLNTLQQQQQQQQQKVQGQPAAARPLQVPPGLAAVQQMQQGLMAGMIPAAAYAWQAAAAAGMVPGQQNPAGQPYPQAAWMPAMQGLYTHGGAQMGGYVLTQPAYHHNQAMQPNLMPQQAALVGPYMQMQVQPPGGAAGGYGAAAAGTAAAGTAAAGTNPPPPPGGGAAQPSQLMMSYQLQAPPQG